MNATTPTTAPAAIFAALGDETRLEILNVLSDHPAGASATTLAGGIPMTRQAVSKHLQVLNQVGLVDHQRHGREARYAVRTQELTRWADWLQDIGDQWERRLHEIKTLAERISEDSATRSTEHDRA
ncbi:MAG: metalloregulator ArsR/SmtB family transcription factor [Ornithinimicrobium sp.]